MSAQPLLGALAVWLTLPIYVLGDKAWSEIAHVFQCCYREMRLVRLGFLDWRISFRESDSQSVLAMTNMDVRMPT